MGLTGLTADVATIDIGTGDITPSPGSPTARLTQVAKITTLRQRAAATQGRT
jgi:hypothetical protein